jgi:hypothetical protein
MTTDELYFELADGGDLVRMQTFEFPYQNSDNDWDKNCIKTLVTIKAGAFSGQFNADFMTVDFEKFKQELIRLYDDLKGSTSFYGLEEYLKLKINGDGNGHFNVDITACDQPGLGGKLNFSLAFDQTEIKELVRQLDKITKQFPITGDLKIKNK